MAKKKKILLISASTIMNALREGIWIKRKIAKRYTKGTQAKAIINNTSIVDREHLCTVEVLDMVECQDGVRLFFKMVE